MMSVSSRVNHEIFSKNDAFVTVTKQLIIAKKGGFKNKLQKWHIFIAFNLVNDMAFLPQYVIVSYASYDFHCG